MCCLLAMLAGPLLLIWRRFRKPRSARGRGQSQACGRVVLQWSATATFAALLTIVTTTVGIAALQDARSDLLAIHTLIRKALSAVPAR